MLFSCKYRFLNMKTPGKIFERGNNSSQIRETKKIPKKTRKSSKFNFRILADPGAISQLGRHEVINRTGKSVLAKVPAQFTSCHPE